MKAVRSACAAGGPVFDVCIGCSSRRLQNKPVAVDSGIPFCFAFVGELVRGPLRANSGLESDRPGFVRVSS